MEHFGPQAEMRVMPSFSQLIQLFYSEKTAEEYKKTATASLVKQMSTVENRLIKKLANQQNDLLHAQKREELKRQADLIMANIHAIPPGAGQAVVTDYFSPGLEPITLELDRDLTAQQNAQRLYKEYTRMKNAEEALVRQIDSGRQELGICTERTVGPAAGAGSQGGRGHSGGIGGERISAQQPERPTEEKGRKRSFTRGSTHPPGASGCCAAGTTVKTMN